MRSISFELRRKQQSCQQDVQRDLQHRCRGQNHTYLTTCEPRNTMLLRNEGHTVPRSRRFTHADDTASSSPAPPPRARSKHVRELWDAVWSGRVRRAWRSGKRS